ncbi:MAG TPA: HigA family addiction module antitoxin [Thermoanaerobaculia bacterium]|nr:HigA family addiction module antitoxin [Thermoanaerobaculia bacterium]HQN07102.1 HigA family addiction module antitoxin [Thermoanaerobaculia bacterium]HQP84819.1 HigA family addiction module antitoxin [Thermoanaerobaculia bacterium]
MAETAYRPYQPDFVTPPGETLRETIEAWDITQADLAERTGKTLKAINEIVQGKSAITPETALQLERVLSVPAAFWLNREARYQEFKARVAADEKSSKGEDWARGFPVRAMEKRGWLPAGKNPAERANALLVFFGVASVDAWEVVWGDVAAQYRKARAFEGDPKSLFAWLRRGELLARDVETKPWSAAGFTDVLRSLRSLTLRPFDCALPEAVAHCASVGVVLVVEPELPKARVFGATRWLSPTRALVQLSFRYRTEDHFWFTFFHEAGHLLRHGKKDFFVEDGTSTSREEEEADRFAAETLLPTRSLAGFLRSWRRDEASLRRFAEEQGIAPGIVVGRLQHEGAIPPSHLNGLRRRIGATPA